MSEKINYRKHWFVRVHKPDNWDKGFVWNLLYSETWEELHEGKIVGAVAEKQSLPKREGGPETKGKCSNEMGAVKAAKEVKNWYEKQDEHEKKPKMKEHELK